jgi:hypothetical protein
VLTCKVIVALVVVTGSWAYFTSSGTGAAQAMVGSLSAPTITSGTAGAGTVALSWSTVAPPNGSGSVKYYVSRSGGAAAGNCPSQVSPSAVTSCTDSGLTAGSYSYTVTAVWQTWTATSGTSSVLVQFGALDHFSVVAPSSATAGGAFSVTVTAKDQANNTITSYPGTINFTSSDGQAVLPANYTYAAGDNGSHTFTVTLKTAGSESVTASDTVQSTVTGSASVSVGAAAASRLTLSAASTTPTAGSADNLTITALDPYGNTATSYAGSKNLTFSGAHAIGAFTPTVTNSSGAATNFGAATAITFTGGVASVSGSSNGVMTLYKAESASITVSDGSIGTGVSPLAVTVGPAAARSFTVPTPASQTAGTAFNVTVTALDTYGNTATGFTGSQTIAFSGPSNSPNNTAPSYPASVTFTTGSGTASITLYDAQTTTLTATQGSVTGSSGGFTVTAGTNARIAASATSPQTAGTAFNVTLTAQDGWGNAPGSLGGTKSVTFSGPSKSPNNTSPTYPATVTFAAGTATASVKLVDAQTTTITATDTTDGYAGVASGNITVNPAAVNQLAFSSAAVSGATSATANLGPITVQERDQYANPTTTAEVVSLSSNSTRGVFSTSQFGTSITSVSIPAGQSSVNFYYGDRNTGTPTITASKSGLTSGTQTETITTAPAGLGMSLASGSTGTPSISCGTISASYTCNVTGVGAGGHVVFYVTFLSSTGTQVVYSTTQSSTITESGQNSGTVTIAAGASSSSPNTLTASHTGGTTNTSTLTFGAYTLAINVSS